ncbi:hypothetical protein Poly51_09280 [Rubripirellula tenax]|uniref:Uncharacterized protein n=1 Tax=Rubripirellula tenax TaxID=2528015 RepID=A0A5C6FGT3_9BACT|nr:DUF6666 family protein [Rubripirellula tenax]TWU60648.1 hypothetical protein Poly51_09280 [Rubripirellula tenax]
MITSDVTRRRTIATSFLLAMAMTTIGGSALAAGNQLRTPQKKRTSTIARAATGQVRPALAEAPLDGTLIRSKAANQVRQVGFLDGCTNGCGPVCDCCDSGPSCGMESSCGIEAGCGFEPGCGFDNGCGVESCQSCGPPTCGMESYLGEPACGMEMYGDCSCDACCGPNSIPVCLPLLRINWCRFQFFAGVQGFKGPMNFANTTAANPNSRSGSGSFGFYEGLNEGRSLKRWLGWDMAAQLGFRATQSNLSGAEFTDETRNQVFVTGGLFRRVDYGLQYGLVFDYLNDDWWYQGRMTQLRGEVSWKTADCHGFGFQFMSGLGDDSSDTFVRNSAGVLTRSTINFEPTDQYRLFYRRLLAGSGDWTAFGGWTDRSDTILGAGMNLPLRQKLMLSLGSTYLIPNQDSTNFGNREENWNISMGLVYRPGGPMGCGRYCRPLFDVADNGTFMVNQK